MFIVLAGTALFFFTLTRGGLILRTVASQADSAAAHVYPNLLEHAPDPAGRLAADLAAIPAVSLRPPGVGHHEQAAPDDLRGERC
ncbi:MAG: hypothetical protein IPF39_05795 [Comamonadaceae bacterium]|uniref:hypothetical protein n=1 Tax=Candidatus Skiveiella danica TaxID=3386177 RepID=UPI00390B9154|nr:hypothetical protein [Comamonadaceae bacterium]